MLLLPLSAMAQNFDGFSATDDPDDITRRQRRTTSDSIQSQHKQVMRGLTVWTIDELSGERTAAVPDTTWYMRMNHIFASGLYGEYNTLGNNGSPRQNRIFTDRASSEYDDFIFVQPYNQFIVRPADFHFTNTYSPITNLDFNSCGDKTNGEDHLKARFAVNAGKRLGFGFKFDYLYAPGYYTNHNTAHFGYTMWGSYLGEQYQAHILLTTNHQKVAENGGIISDEYITHPESFADNFTEAEIPVRLQSNWNRNDNQHVFFNHRYALGFKRRVPMTEKEIEAKKFAMASAKSNADAGKVKDGNKRKRGATDEPSGRPDNARIVEDAPTDSIAAKPERITVADKHVADSLLAVEKARQEAEQWMKDEFVPVTSFFHTLTLDNYKRTYLAYRTPENYYLNDFYTISSDSISDVTSHLHIRNNLGIALLEGFNKYAQFGIKAYASHELKRFTLPDTNQRLQAHTENNILIGGELSREQGTALHFRAGAEFCAAGADIGQVNVHGNINLNFPLLGDTIRLDASGSYSLASPSYYTGHYHSRHFWWDNDDQSKESRTHLEGILTLDRTQTSLRVAVDNISNYTYFSTSYFVDGDNNLTGMNIMPHQASENISVLTAQLKQDFKLGPLHWDNVLTFQHTTNSDILPLPALNVYTGLYLRFKIARVLDCDLGADARYFTKYYAPEYAPQLSTFAVQDNKDIRVKLGNYPIVNVFANFQLKYARFFIMMSHVNWGDGGNYFLTPHHPINTRILRFGVNWNFYN